MPVALLLNEESIQDSEEIRALPVTLLGSFAVKNSGRVCPGHNRRPDDAKPVPHWNTMPLASQLNRRKKNAYLDKTRLFFELYCYGRFLIHSRLTHALWRSLFLQGSYDWSQ